MVITNIVYRAFGLIQAMSNWGENRSSDPGQYQKEEERRMPV